MHRIVWPASMSCLPAPSATLALPVIQTCGRLVQDDSAQLAMPMRMRPPPAGARLVILNRSSCSRPVRPTAASASSTRRENLLFRWPQIRGRSSPPLPPSRRRVDGPDAEHVADHHGQLGNGELIRSRAADRCRPPWDEAAVGGHRVVLRAVRTDQRHIPPCRIVRSTPDSASVPSLSPGVPDPLPRTVARHACSPWRDHEPAVRSTPSAYRYPRSAAGERLLQLEAGRLAEPVQEQRDQWRSDPHFVQQSVLVKIWGGRPDPAVLQDDDTIHRLPRWSPAPRSSLSAAPRGTGAGSWRTARHGRRGPGPWSARPSPAA